MYKTSDIYFATLLHAQGKKFDHVEPDRFAEKRKHFVFEDDGTIEDLKMQYFRGEIRIDPRLLWDSMKFLKSIIYAEI